MQLLFDGTVIGSAMNASPLNSVNTFLSFSIGDCITLLGILLTFAAVLFNLYQSGITSNRIKWIQTFRGLAAKILAFDYKTSDETSYRNFETNVREFVLMLNIKGKYDNVVASFVRVIQRQNRTLYSKREAIPCQDDSTLNEHINCFSFAVQMYLKVEWERVKKESRPFPQKRKFVPFTTFCPSIRTNLALFGLKNPP